MSTVSFLRSTNLKKKREVQSLVNALEKSVAAPEPEVKFNRTVREISGEQVKNFSAKIKW